MPQIARSARSAVSFHTADVKRIAESVGKPWFAITIGSENHNHDGRARNRIRYISDVAVGADSRYATVQRFTQPIDLVYSLLPPACLLPPARWRYSFVALVVVGGLAATAPPALHAQSAAAAADSGSAHVRVFVTTQSHPLPYATVRSDRIETRTDQDGAATLTLPAGQRTIVVRKFGFNSDSVTLTLVAGVDTVVAFSLIEQPARVAPVVVTATRTEQRVEAVPLRVEVLAGEDIGEKNAVRPGDLTQMVAEIPGVRVQPTAPGLGGATLRVQGFRGEYTEFLTDGLPLGSGGDAGFSLTEQPPLDLRQVEVIKGASSALYGPSALGGVVNFVTRRPPALGAPMVRDAVIAASSHSSTDGVAFTAGRLSPSLGYTILGGAHHDPATDSDHDGWADVVQSSRAEIRPRLFWTGANGSNLLGTIGASTDERRGGTVAGKSTPAGTSFVDELNNRHVDAGLVGKIVLAPGTAINVRSSFTTLRRSRTLGGVPENDRSHAGLAEASFLAARGRLIWVAGAAVQTDAYRNLNVSGFDYSFMTTSAFAQLTAVANDWVSMSATVRCDHHNVYGTVCAPLAAVLLRQPSGWSERFSGGLGSFAPTPLTEETQAIGLSRARPFTGPNSAPHTFERARYASFDLGYHRGALDVNATAFASDILHALTTHELASGPYALELLNAPSPTRTRGLDIFAVYTADPVSVTAFYSILHAREYSFDRVSAGSTPLQTVPLNPSRRAGLDVALDVDETGTRVAIEAYYTGEQFIQDDPYRSTTRPYTTIELLATQTVGPVQLFASAENISNVLQTQFDPLLLPAQSRTGRWTTDVWAPLEGRVVRAGLRTAF